VPAQRISYVILPPPTHSMTFNPNAIAGFLSCYKVDEILMSRGLCGIHEKKVKI
jgi:hypothetical protein